MVVDLIGELRVTQATATSADLIDDHGWLVSALVAGARSQPTHL